MTNVRMNSESEGSVSCGEPVSLCRDYVRNVCYRGSKCKYSHWKESRSPVRRKVHRPYRGGEEESSGMQDSMVFCHDFQNNKGECTRSDDCKFIHASKSEEEAFRKSGYLSPLLKDQVIRKGMAPDLPALFGQKPICKDFLKGECSRTSCKFRHITSMQYDLEISQCLRGEDLNKTSRKRKSNLFYNNINNNSIFKNPRSFESFSSSSFEDDPRLTEILQRDNMYLKQRLEDLKKQVSDLSITNEFLLDQNAQLRLKNVSRDHGSSVQNNPQNQSQSQQASAPPPPSQQQQPPPPPQPGQAQQQPIAVSVQGLSSIPIAPVASITCMEGCSTVSIGSVPGSTVSIGVPPPPPPPPPPGGVAVPVTLSQCQTMRAPPPPIVNPSHSQTPLAPSATSINLPPTVSLAPNTALVQETRFLSYPITSILPPMQ